MKIIKRIPLNVKLSIIVAVPLAAMVFFAHSIITGENEKISYLEAITKEVKVITDYVALAEELQHERGLSFSWLIDKNPEIKQELDLQRKKTDEVLNNLKNKKSVVFWSSTMLQQLDFRRNKIDSLLLQPFESNEYFTETIIKIYSQVPQIDPYNNPAELSAGLKAQYHLGKASTYLALTRAQIYFGLSSRDLTPTEFGTLRNFYLIFNTSLFDYKNAALTHHALALENRLLNDTVNESMIHIEKIIKAEKILNEIHPKDWWEMSTAAVNILNEIRNEQLLELTEAAEKILESQKSSHDQKILLLVGLVVFTIVLVLLNIQAISEAILKIEAAVRKLAIGDTKVNIEAESRDVIGKLAVSISEAALASEKIAETAYLIGKGNFDVEVPVRSDLDRLGISMDQMKTTLGQLNGEKNSRLWIQQGALEIAEKISGENKIESISSLFLESFAIYANSQAGAFYVSENGNKYRLTATYALNDSQLKSQYQKGEGLIGQAALSKKPIVLKDVPEDHFKISSTFGHLIPKNLIVFPVKYQDVVIGIVELGFLTNISERENELLSQLEETLGAALSSAKYRLKLEELLEETQAQSEELQSQQEELQSINSELEMQANRLQASEEELRVQQEDVMRANKVLEEKAQEMEHKNRELQTFTEEIEQKNEELRQASQYKSEFLANMSHELRTPLNSILLLSKLLAEKNEGESSKECREYAQVINQSGRGLLELINEILDLSKIEAGKMELEIDDVAVRTVSVEAETIFTQMAREKNLSFSVKVEEDVPDTIATDKIKLGQVLKNLLSNAIKFTEKGSVKLQIKKVSKEANGKVHDLLNFIVEDTGIGIPHDKQNLVFEAFQQVDSSSKRKYTGTGLGLSISKEIASMLGGNISLKSRPGVGSTFIFTLPILCNVEETERLSRKIVPEKNGVQMMSEALPPLIVDAEKITAQPNQNPEVDLQHKKVLIADDDIRNIYSLTKVLEKHNMKVIAASDGKEVLQLLNENPDTDIVLMDIMMPEMDGYEAIAEIRKLKPFQKLPIISITAKAMKGDREKCIMAGASDYLSKPVDASQLLSLMKVWLYK
jgi:signal transduction histidine kinase